MDQVLKIGVKPENIQALGMDSTRMNTGLSTDL